MKNTRADKPMLDLEQFSSLEDAIQKVEEAGRRYIEVGRYGLRRQELSELTLFFMSALSGTVALAVEAPHQGDSLP